MWQTTVQVACIVNPVPTFWKDRPILMKKKWPNYYFLQPEKLGALDFKKI